MLNDNSNSESKEVVDNLVLTCAYDVKHENHCVLFTIEKHNSSYFKQIFVVAFIVLFVYITELSRLFGFAFFLVSFCYFLYLLSCCVRKESAYLFVPVGLQLNASFLLGNRTRTFITWSSIQDFLIVEVISRQRVQYSLIVLTKDLNGVSCITLFENSQPRLVLLEKVYRRFQTILKKQREGISTQ